MRRAWNIPRMDNVWENRYAPRTFTDKEVSVAIIQQISKCIMYAPTQSGSVDHWWLCLGPKKLELKEWLVKNIYKTKYGNKIEYFPALAEAPYLFTSFMIDDVGVNADKSINAITNNAFIGGVILSQAIELGLNALPILCHNDWPNLDESIKKEYKQLMFNEIKNDVKHITYAKDGGAKKFDADTIIEPALNLGLGYGDNPHTMEKKDEAYLDGVVRYSKIRRKEGMLSLSL